jgi:hypothetical protein
MQVLPSLAAPRRTIFVRSVSSDIDNRDFSGNWVEWIWIWSLELEACRSIAKIYWRKKHIEKKDQMNGQSVSGCLGVVVQVSRFTHNLDRIVPREVDEQHS